MSKKIPIHFNNKDLAELEELAGFLSLTGIFGEIPKTIRFSITYTLNSLKMREKSIPELNHSETAILLASIITIREARIREEKIDLLQKEGEKV